MSVRLSFAQLLCVALVATWTACSSTGNGDDGDAGPEAEECRELCSTACDELLACGVDDGETCIDRCHTAFAKPGETPDHDAAICRGQLDEIEDASCDGLCDFAASWGGYGEGITCEPNPADAGSGEADGGVEASDCGDDEAFVEDACIQCGTAGGCAETAPRCRPSCESDETCYDQSDEVPLTCYDDEGICRHGCD